MDDSIEGIATNSSQEITDEATVEGFLNNVINKSAKVEDIFKNIIEVCNDSEFPLIPPFVLMSFMICANGTGVLLNCFIIYNLMKQRLNGIFAFILQMAISDIFLLTLVAVPEMWSYNEGTWTLGSHACTLYAGGEVFSVTSNVYFLITISLHALATENLLNRSTKSKRDPDDELLEDSTEMRSSRHSLVSRSKSETLTTNRSSTLDYRNKSNLIPVLMPIILVWILSASLSLPLTTLIPTKTGVSSCTFVENSYLSTMQLFLSIFQLCIPFCILFAASGMMVYKLCHVKSKKNKMSCESLGVLNMSLFLCAMYLSLCIPRSALGALHVLKHEDEEEKSTLLDHFRSSPLGNNTSFPPLIPFIFSALNVFPSIIKPFAYIYFFRNSNEKIVKSFLWKRREPESDLNI